MCDVSRIRSIHEASLPSYLAQPGSPPPLLCLGQLPATTAAAQGRGRVEPTSRLDPFAGVPHPFSDPRPYPGLHANADPAILEQPAGHASASPARGGGAGGGASQASLSPEAYLTIRHSRDGRMSVFLLLFFFLLFSLLPTTVIVFGIHTV